MSKLKIIGISLLAGFGLEAGKLLFLGSGTYLGATVVAKKLGKKACESFVDGAANAMEKIMESHPEIAAAVEAYVKTKETQKEPDTKTAE